MSSFHRTILRLFIVLVFFMLMANIQAGKDKPSEENSLVDKIYSQTYHFQFREVDSIIRANDSFYKNDLKYNLAVVNYYWWRLISGEENDNFSDLVLKRIDQIKATYSTKKLGLDDEKLFLLISIYAYSARVNLLDYSYFAAATDLSRYYSQLKMSFGREKGYTSLYLTSGLYYFFAGYARDKMPLLAPVLYYYTPGNMVKGLQYIKTAEVLGDWKISQEAKYFLMKINFDVYSNYSEAAKYCNQLISIYPENLLFQMYMFRINLATNLVNNAKASLAAMERTALMNNQLTPDEKTSFIRQAKKELDVYNKKK
jgi:hypothetical protein